MVPLHIYIILKASFVHISLQIVSNAARFDKYINSLEQHGAYSILQNNFYTYALKIVLNIVHSHAHIISLK